MSVRKPGRSNSTSLPSSSLVRMGVGSSVCRHDSAEGSSRFPSPPIVVDTWVTSSSRMASRGGLVTCAKSCLK